jgi:hypothetical protein
MNTAVVCIKHIDCTQYRTPKSARRVLIRLIEQGPGTIVFHQPTLDEGWHELIRTAYESGQEVELSKLRAPNCTKDTEGLVLWAETCSTNGLNVSSSMSLNDRIVLAQRLGYPRTEGNARGTQDFAASILRELGDLIEQSGNPVLIEKANSAIGRWNAECIPLFENRVPHPSEVSIGGKG